MTPITSRTILVTGASSGIGEATARHLAALGHRVVLGARRVDRIAAITREIVDAGGNAMSLALDVTELASMRAFVAAALARHGRIDVLINNAGVMPLSCVADGRVDDWNRMIDVNLRGVLHGIAAVLPAMREQRAGTSSTWRRPRRTGSTRPRRSTAPPSSPCARCPKDCARRTPTCASRWSAPA